MRACVRACMRHGREPHRLSLSQYLIIPNFFCRVCACAYSNKIKFGKSTHNSIDSHSHVASSYLSLTSILTTSLTIHFNDERNILL